jgi:hypothetical protein
LTTAFYLKRSLVRVGEEPSFSSGARYPFVSAPFVIGLGSLILSAGDDVCAAGPLGSSAT